MRIAIVSDIHGNVTAFEAVLADLRETSPDQVLHGGDLADMGASPAEIVDRIRDLGWSGVAGNGEEALVRPEALEDFARNAPALRPLWNAVREVMAASRELLGEDRLRWLRALPRVHRNHDFALVHASPGSVWRAPGADADDCQLRETYASLGCPMAIYGHIHRSFIRRIPVPGQPPMLVANAGSLSLSYDGDPRASYVLVEASTAAIRRVEYDVGREVERLAASGLPRAAWIGQTLRAASPQMP